ncbi:MAG: alpha/beta hydrolase [Sciscionella sp.]|nr:alpha/beta hydrolase [Sciscionella sp.]
MLLPGTASDEVFVRSVFAGPLAAVGVRLHAPRPRPGPRLVDEYFAEFDAAAIDAPIVAGGISFGAHLAAEWAARQPARCAGLLLALPGWLGDSNDGDRNDNGGLHDAAVAPAAVAARHSALRVDQLGVDAALAEAVDGLPSWLATELSRAWRGYRDELATSFRLAADRPAPSATTLRTLRMPAGVAGCTDDAVHPSAVADRWAGALPNAAVCHSTLAALGADRESLGRATVLAWLRAIAKQTSSTDV